MKIPRIVLLICLPILLLAIGLGGRFWMASTRVDWVNVDKVDSLPRGSGIHVRGTYSHNWFCGNTTEDCIIEWAKEKGYYPVQEVSGTLYDVALAPANWQTSKDLFKDEYLVKMEKNWLKYEKRSDNGAGVTLVFDPGSMRFYGTRSEW